MPVETDEITLGGLDQLLELKSFVLHFNLFQKDFFRSTLLKVDLYKAKIKIMAISQAPFNN